MLTSLRAVADLPVSAQGNEALGLLELLREDDTVPPVFRDTAIPVLEAIVR